MVRRLAGDADLLASVAADGEVRVEGAPVGRLDGFRFVPDAAEEGTARTLISAANRVLRTEIAARGRRLAGDGDDSFALDPSGLLQWRGATVGRLVAGEMPLTPRVEIVAGNFLDGELRERARQRLMLFAKGEIEHRLAPLFALQEAPLSAAARGLVFRFVEALGCLPAAEIQDQVRTLDPPTRRLLGGLGLRFGSESVYLAPLLRLDAVRFRALLWTVRHGRSLPRLPGARGQGKTFAVDPLMPPSFYTAIGRRVVGGLAVRADRLEQFAAAARGRARAGRFAIDAQLAAAAGVRLAEVPRLLAGLGYRVVAGDGETVAVAPWRRRSPRPAAKPRAAGEGHPFAKLKALKFA
jgi:ATP-dependent RNA helicase SUPV3L1/SUV3